MTYALDHVFVCCSVGGEEAARLARLGLTEGSANTHPGQGTACRRFFFENAYIELFWVTDPQEAQGELARPTRLWERWSRRQADACPFAVILRPSGGVERDPPFTTWAYRPPYLPPPLAIDVAEDTTLAEPALFYIRFARPPSPPIAHGPGLRRISGVDIGLPGHGPRSVAVRQLEQTGLVSFSASDRYLMTLTFDDGSAGASADLRPDLPVVLRW